VAKKLGKQELFARAYVANGLNGAQAAIAAGFAKKSARVTASRLLTNANVKALIAELTSARAKKLDISADWVLGELRKLAGYDAGSVFEDDGALKPISQWDVSARAALVGLDHEKLFEHFGSGQAKHVGTTRKIKLADKLRALELLGRHLKLFTDVVKHEGLDNLSERVNNIRKQRYGNAGA
jgi:phage terminase small subunit